MFGFQHYADALLFFKYQNNFRAQNNVIKDHLSLLTSLSDEIRMCTGNAFAVPAHKSIFTAAEKGRKGRTEDEIRD